MNDKTNFLTTTELATELKTSTAFVLRKVKEGIIPFVKIGRPYRFDLNEVIEALDDANK